MSVDSQLASARALSESNQPAEAFAICVELLQSPTQWDLPQLGTILDILLNINETDLAIQVCRSILVSQPNHGRTHAEMGRAFLLSEHTRENLQQAFDCFTRASTLEPWEPRYAADAADALARLQEPKQVPPILFIGAAHAGSLYLSTLLQRGLGIPPVGVSAGLFYWENVFDMQRTRDFASTGGLACEHLPPSRVNRYIISHLFPKILVNTRDPRGNLVSSLISVSDRARMIEQKDSAMTKATDTFFWDFVFDEQTKWSTTRQVSCASVEEQVDLCLESGAYKRYMLDVYEDWIDLHESGGVEVLFIKFEDFKQKGEQYVVAQVLDFYGIPATQFVYPFSEQDLGGSVYHGRVADPAAPNFTLRKGDTEEWRRVLTPAQAKRATELIPERLFEKFGWPRE